MTMKDKNRLLSTKTVAKRLDVTARTVARWLRDGELEGVKINGHTWRVREETLEQFIEGRAVKP